MRAEYHFLGDIMEGWYGVIEVDDLTIAIYPGE